MENFSNYLFLLIANLSQQRNQKQIINLFIDGLNSLLTKANFYWSEKNIDDNSVQICTSKNNFGYIIFNSNYTKWDNESFAIFQNAVQMLAIILERLLQETLLSEKKGLLEKLVEERTIELKKQNQEYALLNDEYKIQNEELLIAKEHTEESEANLSSLINNRNESIWSIDKNYNFITFNNFFKNDYLAAFNIELKQGVNSLKILTPELLEFWQPKYDRALSGERVVFEFSNPIGNELSFYQIFLNPIILDGKITGVAALSIDITDQKNTAQSLIESEDKYRAIVENSHNVVYIYHDDNFVFVNEKLSELSGYSKEEINEMKIWDLIHPDDTEIIREYGKKRFAGQEVPDKYNARVVTKNGNVRYCEFAAGLISYKNEFAVLGTVQDITERLQAETKLRKSETRLSNIYQNEAVGIALSDNNFNIVSANSFFCNMLGYTEDELKNKTFLSLTHPDDAIASKLAVQQANKKNKSFSKVEKRYMKKNGQFIFCQTTISQIPAEEGDGFYNLAVIEDITERKQGEGKLLRNQYYLSKAQEIGNVGSWELNIQNSILKWTDETYRIFGIPLGTKMSYELFLNSVHPDDRDYLVENWKAGLNKEPYDIEHRIIINNKVKWVREKADFEFDDEGNPAMAIGFVQDITERVHDKEAIQESEERLRSITENASDFITLAGSDLKIKFLNKPIPNLKKEEVIGKSLIDFTPKEFHQLVNDKYQSVFKTKEPTNYQTKFLTDGGKTHYFDVRLSPIIEEGKVVSVVSSSNNITERKQAEEAIKESENKFRNIFENKGTATGIVDVDGIITDCNSIFSELSGYSKDEIIDKLKWSDFVMKEDLERLMSYQSQRLSKGESPPSQYEIKIINKSGKYLDVIVNISLSGKDRIVSIVDITGSKQAEKQIKFLSEISQQSIDSVLTTDINFKINWVNSAFTKLFGYEFEDVMGKSPDLLNAEPLSEEIQREIYETISKGNKYEVDSALNKRKDGSVFVCEFEVFPLFDDSGNIYAYSSYARDISNRKQAEIALQDSELHYRTLFNESPIPLWEEDFSEVKKHIDKLKTQKVTNFRKYFDEKPEELIKIVGLVKIIDVNNSTIKLHEANSKEELLQGLESIFTNDSFIAFKDELIAIANGKTKYNSEGVVKTLKGKLKHVQLIWHVLPGYENSYGKVFLSTVDITESKEMAETVLKEKNKAQQYLNIAEVMMVSIESSGIVKLINPKGCEILGVHDKFHKRLLKTKNSINKTSYKKHDIAFSHKRNII